MDRRFLHIVATALLAVSQLSSCSSGGKEPDVPEPYRQRSLADFQYDQKDVQFGEEGSDTEGRIVGGRRSSFEGKKQVAFGGEMDRKAYNAQRYQAGTWDGGKNYKTANYSGNTDASRYQSQSRYGAQGAREAAQQSGYDGRALDSQAYQTGAAREGQLSQLSSPGSVENGRRLDNAPRIIPYRDYQRMTIEETNAILGRE